MGIEKIIGTAPAYFSQLIEGRMMYFAQARDPFQPYPGMETAQEKAAAVEAAKKKPPQPVVPEPWVTGAAIVGVGFLLIAYHRYKQRPVQNYNA